MPSRFERKKLEGAASTLPAPPPDLDATPETTSAPVSRPLGMSDATWRTIQDAGDKAAERLFEMLEDKQWAKLKPSDQLALVRLAFDRAFGPTVQKTASLALSGTVTDAVADELARMASADLPERQTNREH